MNIPIQAKFKKGQLVCFEGANHLKRLSKTFIHAVHTDDNINYYYLIEHPNGILLHEKTTHEFKGFDTAKLKFGLHYVVANETELTAVIDASATANNNTQKSNELNELVKPDPNDVKTVTMHSGIWDAVAAALCQQYFAFTSQKELIMMQTQMKEVEYEAFVQNMKLALLKFKEDGILDDLSQLGIQ